MQHTKRVFPHYLNTRHRLISLAVASACAGVGLSAWAQDADTANANGAANGIASPSDPAVTAPVQASRRIPSS